MKFFTNELGHMTNMAAMSIYGGGGRVVRWCWVNFKCRVVLLIGIRVGEGPTALAVGAGGGCLDIFTLLYPFSPLSPSLWETARCRLKYCLKGLLNPKQPTYQPIYGKTFKKSSSPEPIGGGRVVRWYWVNFQCRGVLQFGLQ